MGYQVSQRAGSRSINLRPEPSAGARCSARATLRPALTKRLRYPLSAWYGIQPRNGLGLSIATGQGQFENAGGLFCIFVEEFVEIAHAIEKTRRAPEP